MNQALLARMLRATSMKQEPPGPPQSIGAQLGMLRDEPLVHLVVVWLLGYRLDNGHHQGSYV